MKKLILEILPSLGVMIVLTALMIGWFCFMILDPGRWSKFVDWWSAISVRMRLSTPSFEERCKPFLKGVGMRIYIGVGSLVCILCVAWIGFKLAKAALTGH